MIPIRLPLIPSRQTAAVRWALTLLVLVVWLVVEAALPMVTLIYMDDPYEHTIDVAFLVMLAAVWLFVWCLLHRIAQGVMVIQTHLQALLLALVASALLVHLVVPTLWFAMGWSHHDSAIIVCNGLVLGLLVRHHLGAVLPGGRCRGVRMLGAGVLFVLIVAGLIWNAMERASVADMLPLAPNVQPSAFMLNHGQPVEQALHHLWED